MMKANKLTHLVSKSRSAQVLVLALSASVALSSCTSLLVSKPAALNTYELTTPEIVSGLSRSPARQVLIAEPKTIKLLDTQDIVVRTGSQAVEYLGGAQWADRLPILVQKGLQQSLENAAIFGGVGVAGQGLAIDDQIVLDIRDFSLIVVGGSRARVSVFGKIINDRNGTVRASKLFSAEVPTSSIEGQAAVSALDAAFQEVAQDLTRWIAQVL